MQKWKSIKTEDAPKLKIPGMLQLDVTDTGSFISATFQSSLGVVRIRKNDYGVVLEQEVVETKKRLTVKWQHTPDGQVYAKSFAESEREDAQGLHDALVETGKFSEVLLEEKDVPLKDEVGKALGQLISELPF